MAMHNAPLPLIVTDIKIGGLPNPTGSRRQDLLFPQIAALTVWPEYNANFGNLYTFFMLQLVQVRA